MTADRAFQTVIEARWAAAQDALSGHRPEAAYRDARVVAVATPHLARAMMLCGLCLAPLALGERAADMIRRAHVADPADALVLTRLAEVSYADGAFEAAERSMRAALDRGVAEAEGRFLLARILWASGRIPEARRELDAPASLDPSIRWRCRVLEWTARPEDFAGEE